MGLAENRPSLTPFLSRFWAVSRSKWTSFWGSEAQERRKDHRQRRTRWPQHHHRPSRHAEAGVVLGPAGVALAVIFQAFLGLKTPKTSSIWIEKRPKNGSRTA